MSEEIKSATPSATPSIAVVTDDTVSKKRIKDLETEHANLTDKLFNVSKERDGLQETMRKAQNTPSPVTEGKTVFDELADWLDL